MEYFKSGLKSVLGSTDPDHQPSGAETVERLVERVQTSTLLEDRRNACRTLKALSKKHRVEVGAQGMDALRFILETDKQDCEIVGDALDTLSNIMSPSLFEEEENSEAQPVPLHVGEQFTEIFLKRAENVSLILNFLEEYDFKVRWPALKLLTALLTNKLKDIQEIILVSPMGVSKLMDLLGDSREVIRNDALLLLIQLTKSNANIQKIVTFENAFDRLFDVIIEEGCADGGIVVQDCFILMLNLLKNNISNQNFFKEGSYIQKLCPMFALPPEGSDESCWGAQKIAILLCVLQVVRCLVSPSNPPQGVAACQKALYTSGIFQALSSILMASGVPVNLLTEAICALSEVIRGNQDNQMHFTRVMAPINPPREAIVILLMSMVHEKQAFVLRCSVLYCFQCYLFKNEVGQAQVIQTLLSPSYDDLNVLTCGQLLCSGLYSHNPLSNWLSAVALSHTLIENPAQRENLLRVLLSPEPNYQPVTLIHQVVLLLQQTDKVQSRLGFLILLATWMSHCHLAVKQFLEVPTAIPFLTAQISSGDSEDENEELVQGLCAFVMGICLLFNDGTASSYNKDGLLQLVANRIGLEVFNAKLSEVSRHEQYSRASKQPHPRATKPEELLLDYEFCKLFKVLESMILKTVNPKGQTDATTEIIDNGLLSQYVDVIREQDRRLAELGNKCETLEKDKADLKSSLEQLSSTLSRLTDENTLLKAQIHANANGGVQHNDLSVQIDSWRNECARKNSIIQQLQNELQNVHLSDAGKAKQLPVSNETNLNTTDSANLQAEIERLTREMDNLFCLLEDQEKKLTEYKQLLRKYGENVDDDDNEPEPSSPSSSASLDHNIV